MPALDQWEAYAQRIEYAPGEYIFREYDEGTHMYIVEAGLVVILKEAAGQPAVNLSYRQPGDLLGEIGLLLDAGRSASAMTVEPTSLLQVSREAFWQFMRSDHAFQDTVIRTLIGTLFNADQSRIAAAAIEQELFDRLSDLSSEHDSLAELMKLRHETIGFIVHDLRNPLNVITMALSLMDEASTHQDRQFIDAARGAAQRMILLVDTMLDVDQMDSGAAELRLEPVQLGPMLEDIAARSVPLYLAAEKSVICQMPEGPLPDAYIDRMRIDRVVTNLLDNALKHSPTGGTVLLSLVYADGWFNIAVNDQGRGIPPEERERIFERFAQAEGSQKRHGFGLGLAFCRYAVAAHGGSIRVIEGDGGRGAKFIFSLPERPTAG